MSFKFMVCPARHTITFNVTVEGDCLYDAFHELKKVLNCTDSSYFLYGEPVQFSGLLKRNKKVVFFVSFANGD